MHRGQILKYHIDNLVKYYQAWEKVKFNEKFIEDLSPIELEQEFSYLLYDIRFTTEMNTYDDYTPTESQTLTFITSSIGDTIFRKLLGDELIEELAVDIKSQSTENLEDSFYDRYPL